MRMSIGYLEPLVFSCHISTCKLMHAFSSFDLSTNYARLDVTAVNNGGHLQERLQSFNAMISSIRKGMTPFKH